MEWQPVLFRVLTDLLCIATVGIPIALLDSVVQPFKRGFFCDDESLMHPFRDSTISYVVAAIVGISIPIIIMLIVELIKVRCKKCNFVIPCQPTTSRKPFYQTYIVRCYQNIVPFVFGICTEQIICDITKYSIGRLRPHFFDICRPDYNKGNCSGQYIEDFKCTGTNAYHVKNSRLSFPSGHSSLALYTMVYLLLYLQVNIPSRRSQILRPFLQLLGILLATYTCVSRISDYKHHWSDVLGGAILGAVVAIFTVVFVSPLYKKGNNFQGIPSTLTEVTPIKASVPQSVRSSRTNGIDGLSIAALNIDSDRAKHND